MVKFLLRTHHLFECVIKYNLKLKTLRGGYHFLWDSQNKIVLRILVIEQLRYLCLKGHCVSLRDKKKKSLKKLHDILEILNLIY